MPRMGKSEEDWNGLKLGFLKAVQTNRQSLSLLFATSKIMPRRHICLSRISDFVSLTNFFAYFKFHCDWWRLIGKIKENDLDCRDKAPLTRLVNHKTCQSVYNHMHNIRQIRKFLAHASTNRWSWYVLIIATVFSMVYQLCIFSNCNVLRIPQRQNTQTPHCHIPPVLLSLHYGYGWSSKYAIKSLWSLSRLFTIWGLRNYILISL